MKNIAVFCGSNTGVSPIFKQAAHELGSKLAEKNIGLVYGGAKVGLMGAVADSVLENGGRAVGVLPAFLKAKELEHAGLSEILLVETMHERKAKMYELSDAIVSLPGGFGTLDETFEFLTWGQLSLHNKPVGLLNIGGYYDKLIEFIEVAIRSGFVKPEYRKLYFVDEDIDRLLSELESYEPPLNEKWFITN